MGGNWLFEDGLDAATAWAELGLAWLVQSTAIIALGMLAAVLVRRRHPAVLSVVYQTTLAAVLAAPLVAYALAGVGLTFVSLALPEPRYEALELVEVPVEPAAPPPAETAVVQPPAAPPATLDEGPVAGEIDLLRSAETSPAPQFAGEFPAPEPSPTAPHSQQPEVAVSPPALSVPPAPAEPIVRRVLQPVTRTHRGLAALWVAIPAVWFAGSLWLLLRLTIDHLRLRSVRRSAVHADAETIAAGLEISRRMNVPLPEPLRSPLVASPCLCGLVRPAILLPEEIDAEALPAVLVHELAHRKRGDLLWNLLRHVAVSLLWPQPLMWQLSRRLEAVAEDVCDDYAVALGGCPQSYAAALVAIAQRDLMPTEAAVSLVTFRSMLGQRVHRILDGSRRLSLTVGLAALVVIAAGGVTAALMAGLMNSSRSFQSAVTAAPDDDGKESTDEKTIAGQVNKPDGSAAASADVVILAWSRENFVAGKLDPPSQMKVLGQTRSDAGGRFELEDSALDNQRYLSVHVLAKSPGYGLGWQEINQASSEQFVTLNLTEPRTLRGRLVDAEGNGAAAVPVRLTMIGSSRLGRFEGVQSMNAKLPPEVWPDDIVTDREGWYQIAEAPAGADLFLRSENEPYAQQWWTSTAGETERVDVLSPSQIIKGVVVEADSGKPIPNAFVTAFQAKTEDGTFSGMNGKTDAAGQFRLNPHPGRAFTISAFAPTGSPYLARRVTLDWPATATEQDIRIELKRGVLIEGRVTETPSGDPVFGAGIRYSPRANNAYATDDLVDGWQANVVSDASGKYAIAVPPGPGSLRVICSDDRHVARETTYDTLSKGTAGGQRIYPHAFAPFDLPEDADRRAIDFEVERGARLKAKVVGPDGKPAERLIVAYPGAAAPYHEHYSDLFRHIVGGDLEIGSIPPDGELTVHLLDPIRKLGRVLKIKGAEAEKISRIELEPCGSAQVRLVDASGAPVAGVDGVHLHIVFSSGTAWFERTPGALQAEETFNNNFDRENHWELTSQTDGTVNYTALIPGAEYHLYRSTGDDAKPQTEILRVQPGQLVKLADYVVTNQELLDRAEQNRAGKPAEPMVLSVAATGPPPADNDVVTVRGTVLDPQEKPVAGARVVAVAYEQQTNVSWTDSLPPVIAETRSQDDGAYEIAFRKSQCALSVDGEQMWQYTTIAAFDKRYAPAFNDYNFFESPQVATLRLVEDEPVRGRIVDLEGRPIAGTTVKLRGVGRNEKEDISRWIAAIRDGVKYFNGYQFDPPRDASSTLRFLNPQPVTTDAEGRFTLQGLGKNRHAILRLTGPGIALADIHVVTMPIENFTVEMGSGSFEHPIVYHGSNFQFAAPPSQPVSGVVRDADTKRPIAGARVILDMLAGTRLSGVRATETTTDADGHYELEGLPRGQGNGLLVIPPDSEPYFMREFDNVPIAEDFSPVTFDLELQRGIWITGRVTEQVSGKPLDARMYYLPWPDNPHIAGREQWHDNGLHGPQTHYLTDREGRYRLVGLPGRGLVAAWCVNSPFPQGQGVREITDLPNRDLYHDIVGSFAPSDRFPTIVKEIRPAEDATAIEVDVAVHAGESINVSFVDGAGRPVEDLTIEGLYPKATSSRGRPEKYGSNVTVLGLKPDEKRLLIAHAAAAQLGKAIHVTRADAKDGRVLVTLEPTITAVGRLLDSAGDPLKAAQVTARPSTEWNYALTLPPTLTDADGRFSLTLVAGCKYRISHTEPSFELASLVEELSVSPGETIDLGTIDVTSKERPEVKRTPAVVAQAAVAPPAETAPVVVGGALIARGVVLDPAGKPAAAVRVRAFSVDPARMWGDTADIWREVTPPNSTTDASGRFEIDLQRTDADLAGWPAAFPAALVMAIAPGRGPAWLTPTRDKLREDQSLQLVEDEPLTVRLVDLEGQPIAGASVAVQSIETNVEEDLSKWLAALRDGMAYRAAENVRGDRKQLGFVGRWGLEAVPFVDIRGTSDAEGRVQLAGIGRGRLANLYVSGPGVVTVQAKAVALPMAAIETSGAGSFPTEQTLHGADFTLSLESSSPIEGTVRDAESGAPLAGVRVVSDRFAGTDVSGRHIIGTVSDAQGRYRVDGMPSGKGNRILIIPNAEQPYFLREFNVPASRPLQAVSLDLELHRGVFIEGVVRDAKTGAPVLGQLYYFPWPDHPRLEDLPELTSGNFPGPQDHYHTDVDGRYRIVGLPGRGVITLMRRMNVQGTAAYPTGQGLAEIPDLPADEKFQRTSGLFSPRSTLVTAVKEVNAAEQGTTAVDIELKDGARIALRIVDPDGQPVTGAQVRGLSPAGQFYSYNNLGPDVEVAGLADGEARRVVIEHRERRLGNCLDVSVASHGEGPVEVRLEPCATLKGRVLEDGLAVADATIFLQYRTSPNYVEPIESTTDAEGRFSHDSVPPGLEFLVRFQRQAPKPTSKVLAEKLTARGGETIDLGEVDIASDKPPEVKRTGMAAAAAAKSDTTKTQSQPHTDVATVRGVVLGPNGKPAAGAKLRVFSMERGNSGESTEFWKEISAGEVTGARGQFAVDLKAWRGRYALFVATAPGSGAAWKSVGRKKLGEELQLQLVEDQPIRARLVNLEGQPIAGATIDVKTIESNVAEDLAPWLDALRSGRSPAVAQELRGVQTQLGYGTRSSFDGRSYVDIRGVTDADGRVVLEGIGRGRMANVTISGPGIVTTRATIVTSPMQPIDIDFTGLSLPALQRFHGADCTLVVDNSAPIQGFVRDAKTGEPLAGVTVVSNRIAGHQWVQNYLTSTVSDANGRYRLDGMPSGQGNNVLAIPPGDQPYLLRDFDVPESRPLETVTYDLALHRGVFIEGRVLDSESKQPVYGQIHYLPWPDHPNLQEYPEFNDRAIPGPGDYYHTDAEGRFRVVGLPGRGLVELSRIYESPGQQAYPIGQGVQQITDLPSDEAFEPISQIYAPRSAAITAIREVMAAEQAVTHVDIELQRGDQIALRLTDPQGKPVAGARVRGVAPVGQQFASLNAGPEINVSGLAPGEIRDVVVQQDELGLCKAITVSVDMTGSEPVDVKLEPAATMTARLLSDGEPLAHARVSVRHRTSPFFAERPVTTNEAGEFTYTNVPAGMAIDVYCDLPNGRTKFLISNFEVRSGERIAFGDVELTSDEQPKPKRTAMIAEGATGEASPASSRDVQAESALAESPLVIRGVVLDPEGKPAEGVNVRLIGDSQAAWPKPRKRIDQTTAADGRFELTLPPGVDDKNGKPWPVYGLIVTGSGWASDLFSYGKERAGTEAAISLKPQVLIEGRIINLEGQPVAGVRVALENVTINRGGDLTKWLEALRQELPDSQIAEDWLPNFGLGEAHDAKAYTAETDANGRFQLLGVGPHQLARLKITGGGLVASRIEVANVSMAPIAKVNPADIAVYGPKLFGRQFELPVEPSQIIEGIVKDAATGEPISGIQVESWKFAGSRMAGHRIVETTSDADGRYRLEGMPRGEGNQIVARPSGDQPYLTLEFDVPAGRGLEPVSFDLPLHRGVLIRGQVRDAGTREPLDGQVIYLPWPSNPRIEGLPEFNSRKLMGDTQWNLDAEGRFTVVGLPGRGLLSVVNVGSRNYPRGQGFDKLREPIDREAFKEICQLYTPDPQMTNAIQDIDIAEDAQDVSFALDLHQGESIQLTAVDPAGKPIEVTRAFGLLPGRWGGPTNDGKTNAEVKALSKGDLRQVTLINLERNLGATLEVSLEDPMPREPVRLQPLATVTGRLVSSEGEPLPGDRISVKSLDAMTAVQFVEFTDRDGYFRVQIVAAPFAYWLWGANNGGVLVNDLRVEPGETIDLGSIDKTVTERPPIKRTPAKFAAISVKATDDAISKAPAADTDTLTFAGSVVSPDGKPVAGAKLHVIYYTPKYVETKPRATSGADGTFRFSMKKSAFEASESGLPWEGGTVIAVAEGYGPAWVPLAGVEVTGEIRRNLEAKPNFDPKLAALDPTLRLVADDVPIEGRLLSLEGQPIADARVQLLELHASRQNSLDAWLDAVENKQADYYQARDHVPSGFGGLHQRQQLSQLFPIVKTDAEGRFRLSGIGRERIVMLQIEGQGVETRQVNVRTRPGPTFEVLQSPRDPELGSVAYHGSKFELAIGPSRDVVGTVRDEQTGEPLAGVTVASEKLAGQAISGAFHRYVNTTTDADGKYRLSGLPVGENSIIALPKDDASHLAVSSDVEVSLEREPSIDFELPRGIWIRGRVTDAKTGAPLRAWVEYFAFRDNPAGQKLDNRQETRVTTDPDGRFAVRGVPGRGIMGVTAMFGERYPRGVGADQITHGRDSNGLNFRDNVTVAFRTLPSLCVSTVFHQLKEINPDSDADPFEVDFALEGGPSLKGVVLDPEGKPLAGAMFADGGVFGTFRPPALKTHEFAVQNFVPGRPRRISFYHEERKLAGSRLLKGDESSPIEVTLAPWGTVMGRVLMPTGEPAENVLLYGTDFERLRSNDSVLGVIPDRPPLKTDGEGRFRIEMLAADTPYALSATQGRMTLGTVTSEFTVAAGETKDLGDLTVQPPKPNVAEQSSAPKPAPMPAKPEPKTTTVPVKITGTFQPGPVVGPLSASGGAAVLALAPDEVLEIRGNVLKANGQPADGAEVFVSYFSLLPRDNAPQNSSKPQAIADAKGEFTFKLKAVDLLAAESNQPWNSAKLVAKLPGQGMGWLPAAACEPSGRLRAIVLAKPSGMDAAPDDLESSTIKLVADSAPLRGRVVNLEGEPIAGALVRVLQLMTNRKESLDPWLEVAESGTGDSYGARNAMSERFQGMYVQNQLEALIPVVKSDADGRFEIAGLGRERIAELQIEPPGYETQRVFARTRAGKTIELPMQRDSPQLPNVIYHGAEFVHVATPSPTMEGVVRDMDSGQPLAGVSIRSHQLAGNPISGWSQEYIRTTTDAQGRYQLRGMPLGKNEVVLYPPAGEPYVASVADLSVALDQTGPVDLRMKRGVWIEGQATDAKTGEPVRGQVSYFSFRENPNLRPGGERLRITDPVVMTDSAGRYRLVGLPGRGLIAVTVQATDIYPRGAGVDAIEGGRVKGQEFMFDTSPHYVHTGNANLFREVNPADDAESIQCDLMLDSGPEIAGAIVDGEGQPVSGCELAGSTEMRFFRPLVSAEFVVRHLKPGEKRPVLVHHAGRKLAGNLVVHGEDAGPLKITLVPSGSITGRLVDESGGAIEGAFLYAGSGQDADQDLRLNTFPKSQYIYTDADGRFTISGLAPGVKYTAVANQGQARFLGIVFEDVTVESGESKDLGDLKPRERVLPVGTVTAAVVAPQPSAAAAKPDPSSFTFTGTVLDPTGKPSEKVHVSLLYFDGVQSVLSPSVTTAADGSFSLAVPVERIEAREAAFSKLLAIVEGRIAAWDKAAPFEQSGEWLKKTSWDLDRLKETRRTRTLTLAADDVPILGRLLTLEGQPVVGARVRVQNMLTDPVEGLTPWLAAAETGDKDLNALWKFLTAGLHLHMAGKPLEHLLPQATTDETGRFVLSGIGRDRFVELTVSGDDLETHSLYVRTRPGQTLKILVDPQDTAAGENLVYGPEFQYVLPPSRAVEGTVRDADSGEPLAGIQIIPEMLAGNPTRSTITYEHFKVTTDERGRYRLTGLPMGENRVAAMPPKGMPYVNAVLDVDTTVQGQPKTLDFKLKRGVWVRGRATDAITGRPLRGHADYYALTSNPALQAMPGVLEATSSYNGWTTPDGTFQAVALPGPGLLSFYVNDENELETYPRGTGAEQIDGRQIGRWKVFDTRPDVLSEFDVHYVARLDVDASVEFIQHEIKLDPGKVISATFLDPAGQPLAGAQVAGLTSTGSWHELKSADFKVMHMKSGESRRLQCFHKERYLAGNFTVTAEQPGEITFQLEPAGTITGRLLDERGEPAANANLWAGNGLHTPASRGIHPGGQYATTDGEGRFRIEGLPPNLTYTFDVIRSGLSVSGVIKDVVLAAGESRELGDVAIGTQGSAAKPMVKPAGDAAAGSPAAAAPITFTGTVLGPDGKPHAGAKVVLIYSQASTRKISTPVVSDPSGKFSITLPASEIDVDTYSGGTLAASAAGTGIAWEAAAPFETSGRMLRNLRASEHYQQLYRLPADRTLRLVGDVPVTGRIVNLEGQGVPGALVQVTVIQRHHSESPDTWLAPGEDGRIAFGREQYQSDVLRPDSRLSGQPFPPVTTDADGHFRLVGLGRERLVNLTVSGEGIQTDRVEVLTRDGRDPRATKTTNDADRAKVSNRLSKFDFSVAPSLPIVGVVRDADSNEPIAGVRILSQRDLHGDRFVFTDAAGRYALKGLPIGKNEIVAIPEGLPYLPVAQKAETDPLKPTAIVDLTLKRGVMVRGRVIDGDTQEPLAGARIMYLPFDDNPDIKAASPLAFTNLGERTDNDGRFQVAALKGHGLLTVMATDNYPRGAGLEKIAGADPDRLLLTYPVQTAPLNAHYLLELAIDNPAEETNHDIQLYSGRRRPGTVLDPDGKPLTGTQAAGLGVAWEHVESSDFEIKHLNPGESRRLRFYHAQRQLAGAIDVHGDETTPVVVKLQPAGAIRGRLVYENGEPAANVSLSNGPSSTAMQPRGSFPHRIMSLELQGRRLWREQDVTDSEGRFAISGLVAGDHYSLEAVRGGYLQGIAFEGLTVAAGESKDLGELTLKPREDRRAAAAPMTDDSKITFSGTVLGPDGRPHAGAKLYALPKSLAVTEPVLVGTTTAEGRFTFTLPRSRLFKGEQAESWRAAQLAAVADGRGIAWALLGSFDASGEVMKHLPATQTVSDGRENLVKDGALRLVADDVPIVGRVVDIEGRPVAGARIRVLEISRSQEGSLDNWLAAIQDQARWFEISKQHSLSTRYESLLQIGSLFPGIATGDDGRFTIHGIGRESVAWLQIEGSAIETRQFHVRTRAGQAIAVPDPRWPDQEPQMYYGATFDYVAGPSRPVDGIVRDADSGAPLAGARISAYRLANGWPVPTPNVTFYTDTDREGRFRLTGLPVGKNEILVTGPHDEPYLAVERDVEVDLAKDAAIADSKLKRGVWIRGRVADAQTRDPLRASIYYHAFADNPHLGDVDRLAYGLVRQTFTDAKGKYRIAGLPGRGIVSVRADRLVEFPKGVGADKIEGGKASGGEIEFDTEPRIGPISNYNALADVHPAEDGSHAEQDFMLVPGKVVTGTVVDPEGKPLAGVAIYGAIDFNSWRSLDDERFAIKGLEPGKPRYVQFYHAEQNLAGSLLVQADSPSPQTVKLERAGTIVGRVLDEFGNASPQMMIVSRAEGDRRGQIPGKWSVQVNAEGRFTIPGITPSETYSLSVYVPNEGLRTLLDSVRVAGGETKDLGEIKLRPRAEMKVAAKEASATARKVFTFSGTVLGPNGKPHAGAKVVLSYRANKQRLTAETTSGPDGKFTLQVPESDFSLARHGWSKIYAAADGLGVAWEYLAPFETSGALITAHEGHSRHEQFLTQAKAPTLKLVEDQVVTGKLVNLEGRPVAGATIAVHSIHANHERGLKPWLDAAKLGEIGFGNSWRQLPDTFHAQETNFDLGAFCSQVTTNADGDFRLTGMGRDRVASVIVSGPGIESREVTFRTQPGEVLNLATDPSEPNGVKQALYAAEFEYAVAPSLPLVGTVRDSETNAPLAGVEITPEWIAGNNLHGRPYRWLRTETDAEGRYRLEGLPIGENGIAAVPGEEMPYPPVALKSEIDVTKPETTLDFKLKRGVWIRGRVTDGDTGEPIVSRLQYLPFADNEHIQDVPGLYRTFGTLGTDDDGNFKVVALPGRGLLTQLVGNNYEKYPRAAGIEKIEGGARLETLRTVPFLTIPNNVHYLAELNIDGTAEHTQHDVKLYAGRKRSGRVLDPQGQPLAGVRIAGLTIAGFWQDLPTAEFTVAHLSPGEKRRLTFYHETQNLAASVEIGGDEDSPISVTLKPAATVTGRLRFENGDLANRVELSTDHRNASPGLPLGLLAEQHPRLTGSDGSFTLKGLVPGLNYSVHASRSFYNLGNVFKDVTVAAGETKDLGELTIPDPQN